MILYYVKLNLVWVKAVSNGKIKVENVITEEILQGRLYSQDPWFQRFPRFKALGKKEEISTILLLFRTIIHAQN